MKRLFRITGALLLTLAGMVAILYAFMLVVNRSDRPPSAAASRLDQVVAQLAQARDQDNGFVPVMGFDAGVGQDPVALGMQRIAWTRQVTAKNNADLPRAFPATDQRPRPEPTAAMKALGAACKFVEAGCHAALEGGADTIDAWLAADGALLERYQGLLLRPAWRETAAIDARLPGPPFARVLDGQRLLLLQAWRDAGRGDAASVNRLLQRDGVFWRMVLASSDTLIPKVIARTAVARNFRWGSLIIRRLPLAAAAAGVPGHWQQEITVQERSLLQATAGEYRYIAQTDAYYYGDRRAETGSPSGRGEVDDMLFNLMRPTFQPQDYKNRYAETATAVSDMLDVPYPAFPAAVQRARALVRTTYGKAHDQPFYNWPGNVLLAYHLPDYTAYSILFADLEGVRRLALLAVQLRVQKVAPADMARQLAQSPLRNPYNGQPFAWSEGALVFVGLQDLPSGRHAILY